MKKEVQNNVRYLLETNLETRDSDMVLVAEYWKTFDLNSINYVNLYLEKLTNYESISRCRRKLQEKHEELRGKRYKERKQVLEPKVRQWAREN